MNKSSIKYFLFAVGLLAQVRVHLIGMIGISEILICLSAPIFFLQDFAQMKREGFMPMCSLMLFMCLGCLIAVVYNQTPFQLAIRGFATPIVFFCSFVFFSHFMRRDFESFKWLAIGLALTIPLSFIFNGISIEDVVSGTAESAVGDANYIRTIFAAPLMTVPVLMFYKKWPVILSAAWLFLGGMYKVMTSESGRSAALALFGAALLIYVSRKSIQKLSLIRKKFVIYFLAGLALVFVAKTVYSYTAMNGMLGEKAQQKYLSQTGGKGGLLNILVGGRSEAFICVYAALDRPIIGYGPWALDLNGYAESFRQKFGLYDYEEEKKRIQYMATMGMSANVEFLPFHSYIFGNWVWYGISGLLLWSYVVYLVFKFFKQAPDAIPQWWPMFSIFLPSLLWNVFFSPFSARVGTAATICAMLFAIGVAQGKVRMKAKDYFEKETYLP